MPAVAAAAATRLAVGGVALVYRLISRLTKDSAAVTKSRGAAGVPVLPLRGALVAEDRKPVTAAVVRASATGAVAVVGVAPVVTEVGAVNAVPAGLRRTSGRDASA